MEDKKPGGKREREVRETKDFHTEVMPLPY